MIPRRTPGSCWALSHLLSSEAHTTHTAACCCFRKPNGSACPLLPDFVLAFHCWNLTQNLTGGDPEKCRFLESKGSIEMEIWEQGKNSTENDRQGSTQACGVMVERRKCRFRCWGIWVLVLTVCLWVTHLSSLELSFYIYKGLLFKLGYVVIKVSFSLEFQWFWECGSSEFNLLKWSLTSPFLSTDEWVVLQEEPIRQWVSWGILEEFLRFTCALWWGGCLSFPMVPSLPAKSTCNYGLTSFSTLQLK